MPMPPAKLLEAIDRALESALPTVARDPQILPASPGSYLLLARLAAPLPLSGSLAGHELPRGWHVYAGSARGPGGLRARLGRHLRPEKRPRWHIDQLTMWANALFALPFPASENAPAPAECALIARLVESGAFSPPVPGFGSSDCRACPAHLLWWRGVAT